MPPEGLLVAGLAVLAGAVVQGVAGFGLALLAAPALALVDPRLVPVSLLVTTTVLPLLSWLRERGHVDRRGLGWALAGRLPGTVLGAAAVALMSPRALSALVALVVLGGVLASVTTWAPRPTPRALLAGGFVSGVTGTSTSIGGPPVALLYQRSTGPQIRATLAVYFIVGTTVSLTALAVSGQVHRDQLAAGLMLLPFLGAGFWLSGPLRRHLDRGRTRVAVLVVSAASALALGVRALSP